MENALEASVPPGFCRTCWRGLGLMHPADWEPAALSGPEEPPKCILVDRRFERLELQWQDLQRPPDLEGMYDRRDRSEQAYPTARLTGVPGWKGLVRKEETRTVVEAGRYFTGAACLVQAVMIWPQRRDHDLERTVLTSVAPLREGANRLWQAVGLKVEVPAEFELARASGRVGHISWEFRKAGRGKMGVSVERIAMPGAWLKDPIREWLAGQVPKGFKAIRDAEVACGGHRGVEIHSRRGPLPTGALGRRVHRLDRAWQCDRERRVYRVSCWGRSAGEIDLPPGLKVHCCLSIPQVTEPAP